MNTEKSTLCIYAPNTSISKMKQIAVEMDMPLSKVYNYAAQMYQAAYELKRLEDISHAKSI